MGSIPFKNRTRDDENFEEQPFLPNFTSGGTSRQQPDSNFIFAKNRVRCTRWQMQRLKHLRALPQNTQCLDACPAGFLWGLENLGS